MQFEGGGIVVFLGVVRAIRLQALELGRVVTSLGLISAGLRLGQFLAVFRDVGFD